MKHYNDRKIKVIGDSHSVIFGGNTMNDFEKPSNFPQVDVTHLGAALAYNLMDNNSQLGKWGQAICNGFNKEKLKGYNFNYVILCFGEIDIRTQVIKQAIIQNKNLDEIVSIIVEKLVNFSIYFYKLFNVPVVLWEPIASSLTKNQDPEYPFIGSMEERNFSTQLFSKFLRMKINNINKNNLKIYSFGIYDQMNFNYKTLSNFLYDEIHLNFYGLNKALDALKELSKRENLDIMQYFKFTLPSNKKLSIKDISSEIEFTLSSELYQPSSITNDFERGYCFHTKEDYKPFIRLDIGYTTSINRLEILNYSRFKDRASSLTIFTGTTLSNLKPLETIRWENLDKPLIVNFNKGNFVKYILLQLNEKQYLHLNKIKVFKNSFL